MWVSLQSSRWVRFCKAKNYEFGILHSLISRINSNLDLMFQKYVLELNAKLVFWIKNSILSNASGKKACLAKGIWYLHYSHVPFLQGFQRVFYRLLLVLIQEFFVCRTRRAISPIFLAHTLRRHNTQRYIHATQFNIITYTEAPLLSTSLYKYEYGKEFSSGSFFGIKDLGRVGLKLRLNHPA